MDFTKSIRLMTMKDSGAREALAQEQIKKFVREAFGYKGESWKDLWLEEVSAADASEVLNVSMAGCQGTESAGRRAVMSTALPCGSAMKSIPGGSGAE